MKCKINLTLIFIIALTLSFCSDFHTHFTLNQPVIHLRINGLKINGKNVSGIKAPEKVDNQRCALLTRKAMNTNLRHFSNAYI